MPKIRRIVIKIGSSSLTDEKGVLDVQKLFKYVDVLANLHSRKTQIVIVSSGAVASGLSPLNISQRPTDIPTLQMAAAVGQANLIWQYSRAFATHKINIGQLLLTNDSFSGEAKINVVNTFEKMLENNVVPIVNENDTVTTSELTFGDNDQLAAKVASLINAESLYIMSDVDGLHDKNPQLDDAKKIEFVEGIEELDLLMQNIEVSGNSKLGTGGMSTKIAAAKICLNNQIEVTIFEANKIDGVLLKNDRLGTLFRP